MASLDTYLDALLGGDPSPPPRGPAPAADAPAADDATARIAAGVVAELPGDPAFTGEVAPVAFAGTPRGDEGASARDDDDARARIAAEVMAELLGDPALTGDAPASAVAVDAPSQHAAAMVAPAQAEAVALDIDADLLAELMSDPALSGDVAIAAPAAAARVAPPAAAVVAPSVPALEPAPAPMRAPALPDLSAFLPPAAASIAPVARVAVAVDAARARTATGGNRWLRVCVGGDSYAFELLRVQEVVRLAPVVAMRGAGHAVLGVMNLRGRIVPVFDLGLWLDVGAVHADERARIVVIERDDELIGVLVTAVEDVVSLGREHVEPPLAGADPGPTLGVARITAAPTVLLDADALFD